MLLELAIMATLVPDLPQTAPIPFAPVQQALASVERKEWNPPTRFDHPFGGALDVQRLSQKDVVSACQKLLSPLGISAHANQRGCSFHTGKGKAAKCHVITVDTVYNGSTPQAVLRHEIGHCNGWPEDHPK